MKTQTKWELKKKVSISNYTTFKNNHLIIIYSNLAFQVLFVLCDNERA